MCTVRKVAATCIALALGVSLSANAAEQKEQDSAYKWGRWAVLSPAAGGEPYRNPLAPGAANNFRPGENDPSDPDILAVIDDPIIDPPEIDPPVVVPNPPGDPVPPGDPRDNVPPPVVGPPVVVPNPPGPPPVGDPRAQL